MIGAFLKNRAGALCFIQPPQPDRAIITNFHYTEESSVVVVYFADGRHEMLTSPVAPELRASFLAQDKILVVHLDDKSVYEQEYEAALEK